MLTAHYYDGRSAQRNPVRLYVRDGALQVEGESFNRNIPLGDIVVDEPLGNAPRCITLPDGARCEVDDHEGMKQLLADAKIGETLVVRLQKRWQWALAAFCIIVTGAVSGYFWGLPAVAKALAPQIPQPASARLSAAVLARLDTQILQPSRLPPARQQAILRLAETTLREPGMPVWRIHFRSSTKLGPNALALPGGDLIILDKLVTLLESEDRINAVVAHEIGHLAHHHSMQQMIQGAVVSLVLATWFGDISSAAVAISGQLLQSGYSRDAEREADRFAAQQLLRCCAGSQPLIEALERLEKSEGGSGSALLSSHPETVERIAAIRAWAPPTGVARP
jgi:Zn-dependent protease with chaperone function